MTLRLSSIYVCRSSVANVSTTHVERAVIVVALVTTNMPGWQEPSTLDISVRVRKMHTNANDILQLHTANATGHHIALEARTKLECYGNKSL